MDTETLADEGWWEQVLSLLPEGYEKAAAELGALQRRREVRSAGDLLRLAFTYAVCDTSLRVTAAFAQLHNWADLSDVALLKRLRASADWLGWLVVRSLSQGQTWQAEAVQRVRIVDASVVNEPGARGTDWRVHLGLDLVSQTIQSVEITGPKGGETLTRHAIVPGEILVADRGYAHRRGVAHVLQHQGHVVVRLNWNNFPLTDAQGAPIVLPDAFETLQVGETRDLDAWFEHAGQRYRIRLLVHRKSAEPTERDLRELRRRAQRKQQRLDPRTLLASCLVMVVTTVPREALSADEVMALYRLRWQVEMAFKRLKSILRLADVRAHDPDLVSAYLHAKLLAAILLERLRGAKQAPLSPPCGEPIPAASAPKPLAGVPCPG